ncbi:MAG: hypothetical protein IKH63_14645 [Prevotella sp.]|nr:hypothetical protein [Prevotella sp.]
MNKNYFSIILFLGFFFCATSCIFKDDWDNPSNWYGSWEAQRNQYEITGIDIDKNKVTIKFSNSDYFNYNRERFGSSHSVKYKRGTKHFSNGATFVSFSFDEPLFVYPVYTYEGWDGPEITSFTQVKKVYVTTPFNDHGYIDFEMLDDNQDTYVYFFRRE